MELRKYLNCNNSILGLGCWAFGGHGWGSVCDSDSTKAIQFAYEKGIRIFDTADVYGFGHSEEILTNALKSLVHKSIICTKFGVSWNTRTGKTSKDISPKYIRIAIENSLKRLKLEFIPVYYMHWMDCSTPLEDAIGTMQDLKKEGKIRYIGVCNIDTVELERCSKVCKIDVLQAQFSILNQTINKDTFSFCCKNKVKIVSWGSLADGLLTGKFTYETTFGNDDHRSNHPNFKYNKFFKLLNIVEELKGYANKYDVSLAQLALRWVLDTWGVDITLFGAKTIQQVKDNMGSLGWSLSESDYNEISAIGKKINSNASKSKKVE